MVDLIKKQFHLVYTLFTLQFMLVCMSLKLENNRVLKMVESTYMHVRCTCQVAHHTGANILVSVA